MYFVNVCTRAIVTVVHPCVFVCRQAVEYLAFNAFSLTI